MSGSFIKIVPNVLSSMRLVLALGFWAMPVPWQLPVVIVGGVSDWLDGIIARRYLATSLAGSLLDAIADKLFTLSVLLTLIVGGQMLWWQGLVLICRDLVVAALALYALLIRRPDAFGHMRPRLPGKLTTSLIFIWLVVLLAGASPAVCWWLFGLVGLTSVLAGLDYLMQFLRRPAFLRGRGPSHRDRQPA